MRLFWLVPSLCLGLLLASCASSELPVEQLRPARTVLAYEVCELPASFRDGQVILPVTINGKGPFQLELDTGTSGLFLSPAAAAAAGAVETGTKVSAYAIGGHVSEVSIRVDRLDCGGMTLLGLQGLQSTDDRPFQNLARAGIVVDGFIGPECFHALVIETDYPRGRVVVSLPGVRHFPEERGLPYSGSTPHIVLTIDGKPRLVAIDTGSNECLGIPDLAEVGLDYPPVAEDGFGALGAGGQSERRHVSALRNEVTAGPIHWHDMEADDRPDAAIGWGALRPWSFVLSAPTRTVYFLGASTEAKGNPRPPNVLGYYCRQEGTAVRLIKVTPGSFMQLMGLRDGDLLTRVNTVSGATWARDCDSGWMVRQGVVTFVVERNGAERAFTATVHRNPPVSAPEK